MGDLAPLPDNLKAVIPNLVVVDQEPSTLSSDPACPVCHDAGWVVRQIPDSRFGEQIECHACSVAAVSRHERFFQHAQIPARFKGCTFDTYPVSDATAEALATIRQWSTSADTSRKHGLFLYGPYGAGKTGLMISALDATFGKESLFLRVPELLDAIRATYTHGSAVQEHEVINAAKTVPRLALDDLGAERTTDWAREKLFDIINHRHDELLETLFTSNLTLAQLAHHIGERTVWRIQEMCLIVHLDGPNLRTRP